MLDFNFVLTRSGSVVEVQGSAEKDPLSWDEFEQMKCFALKGASDVFEFFDMNPYRPSVGSKGYSYHLNKMYPMREQFE